MKDERPLGLKELAQYDSPEVVSAALGRFRRRLLVRGLLIPVILAGIVFVPKLFPGIGHSPQLQFERTNIRSALYAPELRVGSVRFQPIEARRLDENPLFGVRLIVAADGLRPNERLSIEEGVTGILHACEPLGGFDPAGAPAAPSSVYTTGGIDLVDLVVICPLDSKRIVLEIGALAGRGATPPARGEIPGTDRDPPAGPISQDDCAVPINEFGSCAFLKAHGSYRSLGTLTLDFEDLKIDRHIWRTEP